MFDKFSIVCLTLPFVVVLVQGQDQVQRGPPDFCFSSEISHFLDRYHKDTPSPEENNFPECTSWQNFSCCTHALADDLSRVTTQQGLYNIRFDRCAPVSQECARYLKVRPVQVVLLFLVLRSCGYVVNLHHSLQYKSIRLTSNAKLCHYFCTSFTSCMWYVNY